MSVELDQHHNVVGTLLVLKTYLPLLLVPIDLEYGGKFDGAYGVIAGIEAVN